MSHSILLILTTVVPAALIAIFIYCLTSINDEIKKMEKWDIELLDLVSAINGNLSATKIILSFDKETYMNDLAKTLDSLLKKQSDLKEKAQNPLVLYDKLVKLPPGNEYLYKRFNETVEGNAEKLLNEWTKLMTYSQEEKVDFLIKKNAIIMDYHLINVAIERFNQISEFYRQSMITMTSMQDVSKGGPSILLFSYSIDSLIRAAKNIKHLLEVLDKSVIKAKIDLKENLDLKKRHKFFILLGFIFCLVILSFTIFLLKGS